MPLNTILITAIINDIHAIKIVTLKKLFILILFDDALSGIYFAKEFTFTPLKIINADSSSQVQIHKDLHHYVPQNQLIDLFFPPKRYGSTQWHSSRDRTLPGEFSPSSMSELAGGCSERSSDPFSRMRVVCFQSFHIRDKSGIGTPFSFFLDFQIQVLKRAEAVTTQLGRSKLVDAHGRESFGN